MAATSSAVRDSLMTPLHLYNFGMFGVGGVELAANFKEKINKLIKKNKFKKRFSCKGDLSNGVSTR